MGKKGDLSKEDIEKRKAARQERLKNREKQAKVREEAIVNTVYGGKAENLKKKGKNINNPKDLEEAIDRNNKRRMKKGEKIKFKELSKKGKVLRILKWAVIAGVLMTVLAVGAIAVFVNNILNDKKYQIQAEDLLIKNLSSEVYDRNGKLIATISENEKRKKVDLSEMSKHLPNAYVAIEDERFYKHFGMDTKRTVGAVLNFVTKKGNSSYGGSTITQQLVKNLTDEKDRTWQRKVKEISKAIQVEKYLTKEQILELYLNLIYVGGPSIHGVGLRSRLLF